MFNNKFFYILFLIVFSIIAACTPQVESTPITPQIATSTILPTNTATPTFTPSVTPTPVPTEVGSFPIGKFFAENDPSSYFTFSKDGRWSHFAVGTQFALATGRFSVNGDIYTQETNSAGCPPTSFKFSFDGTYLKFQLTDQSRSDTSCPDRNGFYDNTTYIFSE